MKKFDKYHDEIPVARPFLQPKMDPASIVKKVIGSMLGKPCKSILPKIAREMKVTMIRYSSSFNNWRCFCNEWSESFVFSEFC